jgi:hypothetical protein
VNNRLPWSTEGEAILPIDVVGTEFHLSRFPDDTAHVSRLLGQNTGVVQLDPMAQVYAVFS